MPSLVVVTADHHINSTRGLCVPVANLDDAGQYKASLHQRTLWTAWCAFWKVIEEVKREYKCEVNAVFNGDLCDRNKHDGAELISRSDADIVYLTATTLDPALQVADRVFVLRGTEAHVGVKASLEELVARDIDAVQDIETKMYSSYWLGDSFDGVSFDVAHHYDTFSRRPWTVDNAPNAQRAILRGKYDETGDAYPDVAIRAHAHKGVWSNRRIRPFTLFCYPWCMTTAFGHRLGAGGHVERVGGYWFLCDGGGYTWDEVHTVPRKKRKRKW